MPYTAIPLSALPKRVAPEKSWDKEGAAELLSILTSEGDPTASDGVAYADQKTARSEANKAKRLVSHVLPEGKTVTSAIFGLDSDGDPVPATTAGVAGFGWALVLKEATAAEEEAEAATSKAKRK